MTSAEECSNERCGELSNRAVKRFKRGLLRRYTLDPTLGGFGEFNFENTPEGQEHYGHIRERVAAQMGGMVVLEMLDRRPGTDDVPKVLLTYNPDTEQQ